MLSHKKILFILLVFAIVCWHSAYASTRSDFDFGWRFYKEEAKGAESPGFDDSNWRKLDLPHDFSIESQVAESNPSGRRVGWVEAGIGWYRKTFEVGSKAKHKKLFLYFEGVYRNSTVWINGHELGTRPYGYISFFYDISDYIKTGEKNVIAVRVDNTLQPSDRWYSGTGIYRHVWLIESEKVYIPIWGTHVITPEITEQLGKVKVNTLVRNDWPVERKITLLTSVLNADKTLVAQNQTDKLIGPNETTEFTCDLEVARPMLWSPENPNLYQVKSQIIIDSRISDEYITPLGFRTLKWDKDKGFFLNGEQYKLKGVCNHHDYGPLGAAENDKVLEKRLILLKEMGCNSIRTAHNPLSPTFTNMCDRLGILVMDECFDGWHKKADFDYGALNFEKWWKTDLRDFVLRDRNNPSVFIWSIGNETGREDIHDMTGFICKLDPTREVTGGTMTEGVTVAGLNGPGGEPKFPENWMKEKPLVFTEVPHSYSTRGFYRTQVHWRDAKKPRYPMDSIIEEEIFHYDWAADHEHNVTYFSGYDNAQVRINARKSWERTRDTDWMSGEYRWTGFDYLGESFGWPMRGGKTGIIDLCSFPKDTYYLYQSMWSDEPMVHILPHWTHPHMKEGTIIPVWTYTNCGEVELFYNGKSLGVQSPGKEWDKIQCQWMVPYHPGEIKAVGHKNGRKIVEIVKTATEPTRLKINNDTMQFASDGKDMAQITVSAVDKDGSFAPFAANRIYFNVVGGAELRALGNSDCMDIQPNHFTNNRKLFFGLCKAFVHSIKGNTSPTYMTVASILGDRTLKQSNKITFDVQTVSVRSDAPKLKYDIFYTTDGSIPTKNSTRYTRPFNVKDDTTVKAILYTDGQRIFDMEEHFAASNWIEHFSAEKIETPKSANLLGKWQSASGHTLGLWKTGNVVEFDSKEKRHIGFWWYEDPTDEFEASTTDNDYGQIDWKNGGKSKLSLIYPDKNELRITTNGKIEIYERLKD
jgi:beta-galactosidase